MNRRSSIRHEFITLLPEVLEEGVLYISLQYKGMVHLCFCGCGKKVVTPLSPNGWTVKFNGRTVSVRPSIGSWNLKCRSHYWIRNSAVDWVPDWSSQSNADTAKNDNVIQQSENHVSERSSSSLTRPAQPGLIERVLRWLSS